MPVTIYLPLFLLSYLCVKLYIRRAYKRGLLDYPDNERKFQQEAIPVGCGGVVAMIYAGAAAPGVAFATGSIVKAFVTALAILFCVSVGSYDDRFTIPGKLKLLLTLIPATMVVWTRFSLFQEPLELVYSCPLFGPFFLNLGAIVGTLFLILWLTTFVNTFNLLDGADGFATTYALLFVATLAAIGVFWPEPDPLLQSATLYLAPLLLGFLVFNFPPAKAYLGDAGSLSIGLILGILSLNVFTNDIFARPTPLLALAALPLLDASFAIVRRVCQGKSLFEPDLEHLHHALQKRFGGGKRLLVALVLLQLPLSLAALFAYITSYDLIALVAFALYCVGLPALDVFGRKEVVLAYRAAQKLFGRRVNVEESGSAATEKAKEDAQ